MGAFYIGDSQNKIRMYEPKGRRIWKAKFNGLRDGVISCIVTQDFILISTAT